MLSAVSPKVVLFEGEDLSCSSAQPTGVNPLSPSIRSSSSSKKQKFLLSAREQVRMCYKRFRLNPLPIAVSQSVWRGRSILTTDGFNYSTSSGHLENRHAPPPTRWLTDCYREGVQPEALIAHSHLSCFHRVLLKFCAGKLKELLKIVNALSGDRVHQIYHRIGCENRQRTKYIMLIMLLSCSPSNSVQESRKKF